MPVWKCISFRLEYHRHRKHLGIEVVVPRLAICASVALVAGYLGLALAVYGMKASVEENRVTFVDVLLRPFISDGYRRRSGETLIARGMIRTEAVKEALQAPKGEFKVDDDFRRNLLEGTRFLRAGVNLVPDDAIARRHLAELLVIQGKVDESIRVLEAGMRGASSHSEVFLPLLVKLAESRGNYDALERILTRMLRFPDIESNAERRTEILRSLVRIQLAARNFAGMLNTSRLIFADLEVNLQPHDAVLVALIELENYDQALEHFESMEPVIQNAPRIRLLRAVLANQLEGPEAMLTALRELVSRRASVDLSDVEAVLYAHEAGQRDAAFELLEIVLSRPISSKLLIRLGMGAADLPSSDMLKVILSFASRVFPTHLGQIEYLIGQAYLTEGDWERADASLKAVSQLVASDSEDAETLAVLKEILKVAVERGAGATESLIRRLGAKSHDAEIYWEAAEALRKVGASDAAVEILNRGLNFHPYNHAITSLRRQILQAQDEDVASPGLTSGRERNLSTVIGL